MATRIWLWGLLNLLLQGCASTPEPEPPPPPTIVNLQIDSAAIINPDIDGKASPVMLRVYELRDTGVFGAADFFALFDKEQATLGADLVKKREFAVAPGDSKSLTLEPDDDVHALGFFAAFRQLDTAQWRAMAEVAAHQTRSYTVRLENDQLTVKPLEQQP